jgi:long-chain acyl-CoA synthetase
VANLADHLFDQERKRAGKRALIFEGREFSFADIADRVRRLAGGLSAAGVGVGSRVGLLMSACPDFIAFEQAIFTIGAVACPLNTFYRERELAHAMASLELEYLIVGREFLSNLPDLRAPEAATLRAVFVAGLEPHREGGILSSADRLADSGVSIDRPVPLEPSAIGIMLSTSATTGKAKGVMLSLANIRANYDSTPEWLGLTDSTVTMCALPLYNTFGLNQGINAIMVTGATMVLMPRFDAASCLRAIEKYRCTFFPAVPTMLQKLLDDPDAGNHDLTSIKRILTGGACVPAALLERIRAALGPDVVVMTGYGLTEGTALVSLEHAQLDGADKLLRPKSIGKVLPGMELRIFDENGLPAETGKVGEIGIRGPNVMLGYFKCPEETARVLVDGWLHTGDLGYMDADDYAFLVDRKKDVIIRGGQNIYPADIEEVLYQHPAVSEVAVIGAADELLGEVPVAYVALRRVGGATAEELIARCKQELSHYKVPAAIRFLPELPKGPTGKILKRALVSN